MKVVVMGTLMDQGAIIPVGTILDLDAETVKALGDNVKPAGSVKAPAPIAPVEVKVEGNGEGEDTETEVEAPKKLGKNTRGK